MATAVGDAGVSTAQSSAKHAMLFAQSTESRKMSSRDRPLHNDLPLERVIDLFVRVLAERLERTQSQRALFKEGVYVLPHHKPRNFQNFHRQASFLCFPTT